MSPPAVSAVPIVRRGTITGRAVLVTSAVALLAVVITALVALPVTIRAADADIRRSLANQATVAARAIQDVEGQPREQVRTAAVVQELREQGIEVVVIRAGQPDREGLPPPVVRAVANGERVSQRALFHGRVMLVEGRPAGAGDGIVLLAAGVTVRSVAGRLWLALGAGLLAGILAGVLLARRLSRPLRQVAAAARRLSAGERTVRAPTDAPAEVAAVSMALNDLADALATSEGRQRMFLTSVSHELRTPLTTMKGYAEALADGVIGPAEAQRTGATMLAETEHLGRLVEDLLALARLEADDFPLEFVQVDLVGLAAAAGDSWRHRCTAVGVPLRLELPDQPVVVRTDPGRVRQVLDGLLENALRVVEPGAPIVIGVRDAAGSAVLEVRDGGPGFSEEDLAVVFERGALYERYKGVRKVGSGLGLSLAHRLVGRLGGRLDAGHAPEGGARLTVRLPC